MKEVFGYMNIYCSGQ